MNQAVVFTTSHETHSFPSIETFTGKIAFRSFSKGQLGGTHFKVVRYYVQ